MATRLDAASLQAALAELSVANARAALFYPGEPLARQPLHTVYDGAQFFDAGAVHRAGRLALEAMDRYAPDAQTFAEVLGFSDDPWLTKQVYERVRAKLQREPVEDYRLDFEDGFGTRPDPEEDAAAVYAAREVARGMAEGTLSPFIGIRIKPLSEELKVRSIRTLDLFVSTLVEAAGGLPDNFVVTMTKVSVPEQVAVCARLLGALERVHGLPDGTLRLEIMIELTQSIFGPDGRSILLDLARAGEGRVTAAHFGTYDYTASVGVTAQHQVMDHATCDFAKHMMQVAYARSGIMICDGSTNVLPVGPHTGDLSAAEAEENRQVVHRAWRLCFGHIQHSLAGGFFQGWDLHPAQIPVRYAACYAFFLRGLSSATARLKLFVEKASAATLLGDVFDDAATGQGLLNYFLRAHGSGALTDAEVLATGLTLDELHGRSFTRILERRKQR